MSNTINSNSTSSLDQVMSSIDMGPTDSLSFMYAQLQLAQASICKDQSLEMMDKIQDNQAKQQEVADMIAEARTLQQEAEASEGCTGMSTEMIAFYDANGISYDTTGSDTIHSSEEWEYNIQSLTNYQETLSTSTQTDMVLLQDFMGQYNSYIQGANKAATDGVQTLQSILTR